MLVPLEVMNWPDGPLGLLLRNLVFLAIEILAVVATVHFLTKSRWRK